MSTNWCYSPGRVLRGFAKASSVTNAQKLGVYATQRCMSSASDRFAKAQEQLKSVGDQGNDVKLKLYGLYKQATAGKNTTKKPGMMDLVGKAKWDAWNSLGDMSQEEAQNKYAELVESLGGGSAASGGASAAAAEPGVVIEVKDGVRTIRLDRPKKKNALTKDMYMLLGETLREANKDENTNIVVITGTGDYFCSGNDLGNFANVTDPKKAAEEAKVNMMQYVASYIDLKKPLIVLVNGPAVGIAVTVLGLADVVYATERATFVTPFSSLGQSPEACSSYTFPRIMGYAKASEILFFNQKITAREAEKRGLVTEVFPDDTFAAETAKRVQAYAKLPVKSLVYSKDLVRGRERQLLHDVNEAEGTRLVERWQSEDCMRAIMSFFSRK